MQHPFAHLFEKALKHSSPQENLVLEEAEALRKKGYRPVEIYSVLEKLHQELLSDRDMALVKEALEEFSTYLD